MDYFIEWYIELIHTAEKKIAKLEIQYNKKMHCHKGCCDCCYQQIDVYPYEILGIAHYIKKNKLISFLRKPNPISSKDKYDYYLKRTPCIFLRNGTCLIHEIRPITCLNYYSESECSPINKIINPNQNYSYHEVEEYITTQVAIFMNNSHINHDMFYNTEVVHLMDYLNILLDY